jgi:hypothetical protein
MTQPDIDLGGVEQLPQPDPRGILALRNLPDEISRREDATLANDYEQRHWRGSLGLIRPATDTEKLLLAHLGYDVPEFLETRVRWVSAGIRNRHWPTLEGQTL